MWFTGNRLTLLKNVFAYRTGWRQVSKKLPAYFSVPDFVVNLIWMAPWPDASAPGVAVETVTSSIASMFGEMSDQNPSIDLASGLWVWIPSMVTRIADIGSPLMNVMFRWTWVCPVSTPGSSVTKFSASRVLSGRFRI